LSSTCSFSVSRFSGPCVRQPSSNPRPRPSRQVITQVHYSPKSRHSLAATTTNNNSTLHSSSSLSSFNSVSSDYDDWCSLFLLQSFLEEQTHEALRDMHDVNSLHDHLSSLSSVTIVKGENGGTMVVALPAPAATVEEQRQTKSSSTLSSSLNVSPPQINTSDGRDEGDLWRARSLLVGAAALYGTNFSLVKLLGDIMPVGISTTLRFGLAALATLPWLIDFSNSNNNNKNAQAATLLGLEVGMWNSIGYVAQAVGLETTLASKSAFICSMAVVIVPLLEFATGKKLLARQWVGAVMALVGVAFLELGGENGIGDAIASFTTGDALSLIQPLMFGIGFWKMEKAMHRFPAEARRLTAAQLMAVFWGSATYGLYSLCDAANAADATVSFSTFANAYPWREWLTDPSILFSLFWTGCITTALTIYMETIALETLSATETTLIFSTEPIWGTAFAAAVMGETLGINAAVGAFCILSACLYSNLGMQGLEHTRMSVESWLKQKASGSLSPSASANVSSTPAPFWGSVQNRWAWLPSSLASSLATWNVANSNLDSNELNDIVDELLEKLS
jgi:drug/metabolite transporter (DMT)-like permease